MGRQKLYLIVELNNVAAFFIKILIIMLGNKITNVKRVKIKTFMQTNDECFGLVFTQHTVSQFSRLYLSTE
jgi:hypothetical protein